jgi:hypothetical protein
MKRNKFILLTSTIALSLIAAPALAQTCSDFAYQEDAQANYSRRLDRDGDGVACQNLPRRGIAAPRPTTNRPATNRATIPGWMVLSASPGSQVNVRSTPSTSANAPHYGLVGDRVWATRSAVSEGYTWYFVGFPGSGATGWVRGDLIRFD